MYGDSLRQFAALRVRGCSCALRNRLAVTAAAVAALLMMVVDFAHAQTCTFPNATGGITCNPGDTFTGTISQSPGATSIVNGATVTSNAWGGGGSGNIWTVQNSTLN